MIWRYASFGNLSNENLYKILQLRAAVFVVEQNCAYQDIDDKDIQAMHLWSEDNDGTVLAYCRLLPAGISYPEPSIGRVLTSGLSRGTGLGRLLMQKAIDYIVQEWSSDEIRISAQLYLELFYTSLGFQAVGETYLEDDIPHIEMLRTG